MITPVKNRKGKTVGLNMSMAEAAVAYWNLYGGLASQDDSRQYAADLNRMFEEHGEAGVRAALGGYSSEKWLAGEYPCQAASEAAYKSKRAGA
jgi:hypothetical protein